MKSQFVSTYSYIKIQMLKKKECQRNSPLNPFKIKLQKYKYKYINNFEIIT